jgi:L-2-hydroxyglutarate oxidase|tara:strand:+ start:43 stop:1260 length:1218 start_codon:yes stop_codon:yes gene_type:complete
MTLYDASIIGGGIIGFATALGIQRKNPKLKLCIIEKDDVVSNHQTGRNSGVIHSGIYYKPGSLKASFCVEGRVSMAKFCQENNLKYEKCGKLIVAYKEEEIPRLEALFERGVANKVEGLEIIERERITEIEPHAAGIKALYAPNTGIVDYREVTEKFAQIALKNGADIKLNTEFVGSRGENFQMQNHLLKTTTGDIETKLTINCAGLQSDLVAKKMGVYPNLKIIPFRGEYYNLKPEKKDLVQGLIYPVPDPKFPFLGVHFTKTVHDGLIEAGPNAVLAYAREGYKKTDINLKELFSTITYPGFVRFGLQNWKTGVSEINRSFRKKVFVKDLQKMIPEIKSSDLYSGVSGVRAQAIGNDGKIIDDFAIEVKDKSIHVLNAPSPGATSSIMIGNYIADLALKQFSS